MKASIDGSNSRILISRTDSIGDVMLTLPMAAWLKSAYPDCHITFLCRDYTAPIVACYESVDSVMRLETIEALPMQARVPFIAEHRFDTAIHVFPNKDLAALFKKAKIPNRIGTSHRGFHLLTCNIRPNFSRKRSSSHEAQLNFELLRPLGVAELPSFGQLNAWTKQFNVPPVPLPTEIETLLDGNYGTIVLHPKSQGSAREWPISHYMQLAEKLAADDRVVLFTGTEKEGAQFRQLVPNHPLIADTTGRLTIGQLLYLLGRVDALVACSTGPLHIAGFLGKRAVGLFSPKVPIHPGRWQALGEHAVAIVDDPSCPACASKKPCTCIERIPVERVLEFLTRS